MKQVEKLLKAKKRDFLLIKAHAAGPNRIVLAFEVFVFESGAAATCIVGVDLETLDVELVHEAAGSSRDYAHLDGWHGLVQDTAVIEVLDGKAVVTKAKLGKEGALAAIARTGTTTIVSGAKRTNAYAIDGFVARVAAGKLAMLVETTKHKCDEGLFPALAIGASGTIYAAGSAMANGRTLLFSGKTKFTSAPVSDAEIYSLHETPDGGVMVGCRDAAAFVRAGKAQELSGVVGRVHGVTVFRGTEYWMSHDQMDHLTLSKRTGTKLAKKYRSPFHDIGYRYLDGAPEARMTATDDLLIVTNNNRIHIFDGKRWSQLAIQPDVKKLVKRMPVAMK